MQDAIRQKTVLVLWALFTIGMLVGCGTSVRDVSHEPPYAAMIGQTYRVVGEVDAVGIRQPGESVAYVKLDSRPSLTGPEVASKQPIDRGQTFRIVGAEFRDTILDDVAYYIVELTPHSSSPGVPVHLDLLGDNIDSAGNLNPRLYEQVKQ